MAEINSPQPPLADLEPDHRRLAIELPGRRRRPRSRTHLIREPLFPLGEATAAR